MLFSIYLLLSSTFLAVYGTHLESRLAEQRNSVNTALNSINRFESDKQQLEERAAIFANYDTLSPAVNALDAVAPVAEIQSMETSDSRIIIRGVAPVRWRYRKHNN